MLCKCMPLLACTVPGDAGAYIVSFVVHQRQLGWSWPRLHQVRILGRAWIVRAGYQRVYGAGVWDQSGSRRT
ncbi:hypothetical protein V8C86DRAFT_2668383 [Haematococcus lacustris]